MSLDQRLAMFAAGKVIEFDALQRGIFYMILHIFETDYGQIILKLYIDLDTHVYVWLPRTYNNHFPKGLIDVINSGDIIFKMRYMGSYLKYCFLEFVAIE